MKPGLTSPTALLRRHGCRPYKAWGQCFLHDPHVVERIVAAASIGPDDTVVEIGAGLGILTRAIADAGAQVVGIERDRGLIEVLREELGDRPAIRIVEGDALKLTFAELVPDVPRSQLKVLGNLPYNISSPLIFHVLAQRAVFSSVTVMLQKEVAQRLCASPGTKAYGAPSVICQLVADVSLCFLVGRGAFTPAPNVDSAVVRLDLRETPRVPTDERLFQRVVRAAFGQRRKTLRRALCEAFPEVAVKEALAASAIDGQQRGETLSVADFAKLAQAMARALKTERGDGVG